MIIHCMKKSEWEAVKDEESFGFESIERCGFVHCCEVRYLWRVLPNFEDGEDERVLLCLDEDRIGSPIVYEDDGGYGRIYPHVYGPIKTDAVIQVLDYLKDEEGNYRKNGELALIKDE